MLPRLLSYLAGDSPSVSSVVASEAGRTVNETPGEGMGELFEVADEGGRKLMERLKMGARWCECEGDRCARVWVQTLDVGVVGVVGVVGSAEDCERRLLPTLSSSSEWYSEEPAMLLPMDMFEL